MKINEKELKKAVKIEAVKLVFEIKKLMEGHSKLVQASALECLWK